jgi:hypothetical protein
MFVEPVFSESACSIVACNKGQNGGEGSQRILLLLRAQLLVERLPAAGDSNPFGNRSAQKQPILGGDFSSSELAFASCDRRVDQNSRIGYAAARPFDLAN